MWHAPRSRHENIFHGLVLAALALTVACTLEPPPKQIPVREVEVEGAGVKLIVRSDDGSIRGLVRQPGLEMATEGVDTLNLAGLGLEIEDGRTGRVIDDPADTLVVTSFEESDDGVALSKRFPGTPYSLRQTITSAREGVFIDTWLSSRADSLASVAVTYRLPLPRGCCLWTASGEAPLELKGGMSREYVCGISGAGVTRISIPLASLWRPGGTGLAVAVPLEVRTVRVTYSLELGARPQGLHAGPGKQDFLRVRFDLIGLRPGAEVETGLWLYGHKPDWRPALGAFSEKYREYFEPRPGASRRDGVLSLIDPPDLRGPNYAALKQLDVAIAAIGWNWRRPGEWLLPQALRFDDFTWDCSADTACWSGISVQRVRACLDAVSQAEIRSILTGAFSQYCTPDLAKNMYSGDIARDDSGAAMVVFRDYPLMHSEPESPYGQNMLEQQKRMLDLFPQAGGFYFDNWDLVGMDFAHDDSLAAWGNRPAWYLGQNQATAGAALIEAVHGARKLVMAAAPPNISLSFGLDLLAVDPARPAAFPAAAYLGLLRPVEALQRPGGDLHGPEGLEETLEQELLWGVLPSHEQLESDPLVGRAYRPLFQALRGRQWVMDPGALSVTGDVSAQIYRVPSPDKSGERDLLVILVRPGVRQADQSLRRGISVRVAVPEAKTVARATWLAAGTTWPLPLKTSLESEDTLLVDLPPVGPAGVLRLSQR